MNAALLALEIHNKNITVWAKHSQNYTSGSNMNARAPGLCLKCVRGEDVTPWHVDVGKGQSKHKVNTRYRTISMAYHKLMYTVMSITII